MRIGFDLDNVLISTPPLIPSFVIEKLYKKKTQGTPVYRIPSKSEQLIRRLSHKKIFRRPIKKNIEFIRSINLSDHELYLISGRYSFLKNETESLVKDHKLNKIFKKLFFNYDDLQPHIFKAEIISTLKLDKYIDDDFQLIKYAAKLNKKTKFYYLTNYDNLLTKNIRAISNINLIT